MLELVRAFHERRPENLRTTVAETLHEDAEMVLRDDARDPIRGRERILEELGSQRMLVHYEGDVEAFEWLHDDTLLARVRTRFPLEEAGWSVSYRWWSHEFREGLLRRIRPYKPSGEGKN